MHNNKRRINKKVVILLIIVIIGSIVLIKFFNKEQEQNNIYGIWKIDDVTKYEFSEDNKGKLILPTAEYSFAYEISDDEIYIDFENERSKDPNYKFYFENDNLILEGINDTSGKYTLTKQE